MRPLAAAVVVLALAAGGCGSEGEESAADSGTVTVETAGDAAAGASFEPYQCQPLIQASSNIRLAVSGNEPEQLAHLIPLAFFYDEFADELPDEVREDFETVLEPYDAYYEAVTAAGGRADPEQLEEVVAGIDGEAFVEAATRINTWANTDC